MNIIHIVGPAGTGKTAVLTELAKGNRALMVDPLASDEDAQTRWEEPEEAVDAVIFDHARHLKARDSQLQEALAWCRRHRANMVLVTLDDAELQDLGEHFAPAKTLRLSGTHKRGNIELNHESSEQKDRFWARSGSRLPRGSKTDLRQALFHIN